MVVVFFFRGLKWNQITSQADATSSFFFLHLEHNSVSGTSCVIFFCFLRLFLCFLQLKTLENIKGFNHKAALTSLIYLDWCEFLCLLSSSDWRNIAQRDTRGGWSCIHTKHVPSFHFQLHPQQHFLRGTFASTCLHSSSHIQFSIRIQYKVTQEWPYVETV